MAQGTRMQVLPKLRTAHTVITTDSHVIKAMREWLGDCGADTSGRSDLEILTEVRRQYAGGIAQFMRDAS